MQTSATRTRLPAARSFAKITQQTQGTIMACAMANRVSLRAPAKVAAARPSRATRLVTKATVEPYLAVCISAAWRQQDRPSGLVCRLTLCRHTHQVAGTLGLYHCTRGPANWQHGCRNQAAAALVQLSF